MFEIILAYFNFIRCWTIRISKHMTYMTLLPRDYDNQFRMFQLIMLRYCFHWSNWPIWIPSFGPLYCFGIEFSSMCSNSLAPGPCRAEWQRDDLHPNHMASNGCLCVKIAWLLGEVHNQKTWKVCICSRCSANVMYIWRTQSTHCYSPMNCKRDSGLAGIHYLYLALGNRV